MATPAEALSGHVGRVRKAVVNESFRRAITAIIIFVLIWEFGARSEQWAGFTLPWVGRVPPMSAVVTAWMPLFSSPAYWESWWLSFSRVLSGFLVAQLVGIPLGLAMATSRSFFNTFFPVFDVLRPIPPLAWVPASIIFWPTQEMSIAFVTFLGAFYIVVLNVIGGARSIDVRYFQAAQSMGSSGWDIFKRIILPGTLPSIFTGAAVGAGITWEVVVAAEMISGGGNTMGGGGGGGLGFFIWNSYIGYAYPQIIVGMISIGIAGYITSSAIRYIGKYFTPWQRLR